MGMTRLTAVKHSKPAAGMKVITAPRARQRVSVGWSQVTQFKVPIPRNEKQRMETLRRLRILDTSPEESFDLIATVAAQVCGAPIALITLVDSDRQWFKAKVGVDLCETSRNLAFCAHAIMQRDLFVVRDAMLDKRFAQNPLVRSPPRIRFYAGAPLVTADQQAVGTLCVIDRVPRVLRTDQAEALRALGRLTMALLEARRETLDLKEQLLTQRLAEKSARKAQEVAAASGRAKAETLQRLRHELRATAQGILDSAEQVPKAGLTAPQRACAETVRAAAVSLLKIAEELAQAGEFERRATSSLPSARRGSTR
jgi:hypothetical protein